MAHSGANSGAQPGSRPARAVIRAEVGHGSAELVGDPDRPHGWTLLVDGTAQSHVDLDDPVHLEFEYIRRIGHLIDLCAPAYAPLRALHLGGGAWTLARYVAATRPGSTQTVVELDGPLAEFVGHRLPADLERGRAVGDGLLGLGNDLEDRRPQRFERAPLRLVQRGEVPVDVLRRHQTGSSTSVMQSRSSIPPQPHTCWCTTWKPSLKA